MMPLLCMGTDQTTENLQEGETARAYSQGVSMRTIFLSYARRDAVLAQALAMICGRWATRCGSRRKKSAVFGYRHQQPSTRHVCQVKRGIHDRILCIPMGAHIRPIRLYPIRSRALAATIIFDVLRHR
jgi:hypothetical protein